VKKSDLDNPTELFGEGRGFNIGYTCPKLFTTGHRPDLAREIFSVDPNQTITLYLY
jgi:hypothetical protein